MHKWSSTKPANHQAIRQRNNQRRHRQRVKERVPDLELKLQQTQSQLREALDRISKLESELKTARTVTGKENHDQFALSGFVDGRMLDLVKETDDEVYDLLPPPPPGKSTTLCREAFVIIAQQNYKGIDKMEIRRRLERGFHGGVGEGEECRVDNELLFGLLDFLTSE